MTLEFYEYDPYDAVIHKTADEAEAAATRRIEDFHSDAVKHGEWDEDVQLVEYGVVLPLGRATSHPTGAAAEAPEVNHRDYALAEVEVDAAEFWRELSERAPKLAASLAAAAPSQSHAPGPGGPESVQADEPIRRQIENMVTAHADGDLLQEDFDDLRALIRAERARHAAEVRQLRRQLEGMCGERDGEREIAQDWERNSEDLQDALAEWRKRIPCVVRACSFVLDRAADDDDLAEAQGLLDWVRGLKDGEDDVRPGSASSAPETTPMRTFSWTEGAFSRSRALAVDESGNPLVTDQGYTLVAGPPIELIRKGGG